MSTIRGVNRVNAVCGCSVPKQTVREQFVHSATSRPATCHLWCEAATNRVPVAGCTSEQNGMPEDDRHPSLPATDLMLSLWFTCAMGFINVVPWLFQIEQNEKSNTPKPTVNKKKNNIGNNVFYAGSAEGFLPERRPIYMDAHA